MLLLHIYYMHSESLLGATGMFCDFKQNIVYQYQFYHGLTDTGKS